ncbi:hypothetical protein [Desulfolutivibrio sulfoxidireducens]|uniref:hypothetical protein n=1 Tax=Desulfolutivibrio sulfoxidireducens TaxID=2773299 RepID=UPI00159EAD65|nr:hypothetical protein [Desulfolutivibrio sulfoxidireducens]QLA15658.1 hypothetical protein GD605_05595 [Desulfolutivibrio sulfoxidireducens]QLA19264.1 hypothetical protein GD604_05630 [Desulfolutivibrio sulfoxidireducens]
MSIRTDPPGKPFSPALAVLATLAVLAATEVSRDATAEEYRKGTSYVEERGGVYGTTSEDARRVSAQGGAAGVFVADGLALEAEGLGYSSDPAAPRTPGGEAVGQAGETDAMGTSLMAKWHIVHGKKGSVHIGAGAGGVMSAQENAIVKDRLEQANNADVGLTLNMSESVSLKAQGRYQQIGRLSGGGTEAMGGNVGIKISF